MLSPLQLTPAQRSSPLARSSPVLKLALALGWLVALAATMDLRVPLALAAVAAAGALVAGAVPPRRLLAGLAPLLVAAGGIVIVNALFSGSNADPAAPIAIALGPVRVTGPALAAGFALGARIVAIVAIGAAFAQTTEPTHLVDSLVQQAGLSPRFAYGALAAYQAAPRLAADLAAIRDARRIRGLRLGWHPRILLGLLVRALRHADQLALAMDARGFGRGPRSAFRVVRWSRVDLALGVVGVILPMALLVAVR